VEQGDPEEQVHADIIRANTRYLANSVGPATRFAEIVDLPDSYVSQIIGINPTKNIGPTTARKIEAAFGKPRGWLDHNRPECIGNMPEDSTLLKLAASQDRVTKAAACLRASMAADGADKQDLVQVALSLLDRPGG
jgi:hypothetical protein